MEITLVHAVNFFTFKCFILQIRSVLNARIYAIVMSLCAHQGPATGTYDKDQNAVFLYDSRYLISYAPPFVSDLYIF